MSVAENLFHIMNEIENICREISVSSENVTLIAVTKNQDVELMREAIDTGIMHIGENRVQEALRKFQFLDRKVVCHLIGHLQTNKVKQAVKLFDLIQSVDSMKLVEEIDRAAKRINKVQDILIQINVAREPQKKGVYLEDLEELIKFVEKLKNIRLRGLMTIAPKSSNAEESRPFFRNMKSLFDVLKKSQKDFRFLSMGMSQDYKIAIEEGANMIRVGTAIFDSRLPKD